MVKFPRRHTRQDVRGVLLAFVSTLNRFPAHVLE